MTFLVCSCSSLSSFSWPPENREVPIHIIGPVYKNETEESYQNVKLLSQAIIEFSRTYQSEGVSQSSGFLTIRNFNWLLNAEQMTGFWNIIDKFPLSDRVLFGNSRFRDDLIDFFERIEFKGYLLAIRYNKGKQEELRTLEGFRMIYLDSEELEINRFQIPLDVEAPDAEQELVNTLRYLVTSHDNASASFGVMGYIKIDSGCFNSQNAPKLSHCVDKYFISRFPITNLQWNSIIKASDMNSIQTNNQPVVNVSWNQIQIFLDRLNNISDGHYRLPTSAEWEYACLGGGLAGNNVSFPAQSAHSNQLSQKDERLQRLLPFYRNTTNKASENGMAGNLWEWTDDQHLMSQSKGFVDQLIESLFFDNPNKVIRGGSFASGDQVGCGTEKLVPLTLGSADISFRLIRDD